MENTIIIVAGGTGSRMLSAVPKQFLLLNKRPILFHTLEAFYTFDNNIEIVLVLPSDQIDYWKLLCKQYSFHIEHVIVEGGFTRFHSVKKGIEAVQKTGIIGVHDGVRPLVSQTTIGECFKMASKKGNAIPVVLVNDSLRKVSHQGNKSADRKKFRIVQTPQCFQFELLKKSYNIDYQECFTDDASVIEANGFQVNLVQGNFENIKITSPSDLVMAEALLPK